MSSLIARLREYSEELAKSGDPNYRLVDEADDEILNLRKELKLAKRRYDTHLAQLSRKNSELHMLLGKFCDAEDGIQEVTHTLLDVVEQLKKVGND